MERKGSRIRCFFCDGLVLRKPNLDDLNDPFAIFTKKIGNKYGCICSTCIEDADDEYERIIESDNADFVAEYWKDDNGTHHYFQAGSTTACGGISSFDSESQPVPDKKTTSSNNDSKSKAQIDKINKESELLYKKYQSLDYSLDSICKLIGKKVFGQDEVIKRVVYTIYKNLTANLHSELDEPVKEHEHIFLIGNTGVGKSFVAENVAKFFNIPYVRVDCSSFTSSGYVGDSVEQILERLLNKTPKKGYSDAERLEIAENGIIILDELDKKKISSEVTGRDVTGKSVQQELLKFFEPNDIFIKNGSVAFDTSKLTIIATGACVGLEDIIKKRLHLNSIGFKTEEQSNDTILEQITDEDLFEFGFIPELVGRIHVILKLNDLSVSTLTDIIYNALSAASDFFAKKQFDLHVDPFLVENMAISSLNAKTGARDIKKRVYELIYPALYQVFQSEPGGICHIKEDSSIELLRRKTKNSSRTEVLDIDAQPKYQAMTE